ncbi:MAG: ATP-binding protein [Bacteroidales bacterium]|nr:ATP-binding protein [Candidatus Latescibacterota bacterium]
MRFTEPPVGLLTIPKRFAEAKFDEKTSDALKSIGELYVDNFTTYYSEGRGPAFLGAPGVGKTYAAAAIALQLHKMGVPCYWSDVVADMTKLLEWKDFNHRTEYYKLKGNIVNTPFVVLDDFTYLTTYQRTKELFFEILNARYSAALPTLITGNFAQDDSGPWTAISNNFGGAVSRRIKVMSKGLVFRD